MKRLKLDRGVIEAGLGPVLFDAAAIIFLKVARFDQTSQHETMRTSCTIISAMDSASPCTDSLNRHGRRRLLARENDRSANTIGVANAEQSWKLIVAIVEDSPQIAANKQSINKRSSRDSIHDPVTHECSTIDFFKRVRVNPKTVRTSNLRILKVEWRFPFGDFCSPANG